MMTRYFRPPYHTPTPDLLFKETMEHLQGAVRKISDEHLQLLIRKAKRFRLLGGPFHLCGQSR